MRRILLSVLLLSIWGNAQEFENTSAGSLSTSRIFEKIKPDRISHFSILTGTSAGFESENFNFDGTRDNEELGMWTQISFQYQINENFRFVFNPRFISNFYSNAWDRYVADNPVFGITGTWFKTEKFTFGGGLNTIAYRFDGGDRADGLLMNPGGFNFINYEVSSKFSFGSWVWARYRIYQKENDNDPFPFFLAPNFTYTISDNFSLNPFYQFNGNVQGGLEFNGTNIDGGPIEWDKDETFNISGIYTINKMVTLQPILTVFRETNFKVDKGNLSVWISGRFL